MPTLKDFEDLIAGTTDVSNQFATSGKDGLAFKGTGARLATYFTSSHQTADKAVLQSFFEALKETYGAEAAMAGFKRAGLTQRVADGSPLSVREATLAIRGAKEAPYYAANRKYQLQHTIRENEARQWKPNSTASQLDGPGLRLVTQDQGAFRIHHWNAKNNPDEAVQRKTVELDALVEREVAAIKSARARTKSEGGEVEPMSDRLIYLQAKLNLTERMVAEACHPANLKAGGPSANVFLGPDMFFAPSEGPGVEGSCTRTSGGACTEGEMRRITEGLRRISERHPEVTLIPGTIVWSKPVDPVPIIDGLPRPADMAYNTAPVFSKGSLAHMTYKMTDGGDANTTAIGINGLGGSASTVPSPENGYAARLQVFPEDEPTMNRLSADGKAKVQTILGTMAKQAAPLSKDRDWETKLRAKDAGPRSPYNTIFTVGGKVMALEICRDNANRQAQKEYARLKSAKDPVASLAKSQPGPDGGANLHVMLAAVSSLMPSCTICCTGGIATYNDIGKGLVQSYPIHGKDEIGRSIIRPHEKQEMSFHKYDALRRGPSPEAPQVRHSSLDVKRDDSARLAPVTLSGSGPIMDLSSLERPSGAGLAMPPLERRSSVREAMLEGAVSAPKARPGIEQSTPEETTTTSVTTGVKSVRTESGLDKPKQGVPTGGPTVSVSGL